ncbi:hypothetical protein IKS86_06390 [bacterium]|nr:hypothetical protein [bacterium]
MLTKLSWLAIYFASYFIVYFLILVVLIYEHCTSSDYIEYLLSNSVDWICMILLLFLLLSLVIAKTVKNAEMNTRIKDVPQKNITLDVCPYFLPQVITCATLIFADWWILIDVVIFVTYGVFFVKSEKVYTALLFVIPLGNKIYQSGDKIIITRYSEEEMRMVLEDSPDGIEARILTKNVFYVRK